MKEKTKFVAFSTQKGGAGKTTLTVLAASYLHYVKGFNVAVSSTAIIPNTSIVEMRERDLKLALEDEHYKRLAYEQFTRLQKKLIREEATRKRRWPMPTTSCRKVISIMCSSTFPVRSITRI